jgi:hypothetical protein
METATCAICGTPITKRAEVGWTHDLPISSRAYCNLAWPEPTEKTA